MENSNKRALAILLFGITAVFLVVLVFFTYKKALREPMEYVKHHKEEWVCLLTNDRKVLPYLEQLYTVEDELTINYRDGRLTINESASNMFSLNELEKLKKLFVTFQWETIRLRKHTNAEEKVLEVISSQITIGSFFWKHYGAAFLVYSPNDIAQSGEEIFLNWYYVVLFDT